MLCCTGPGYRNVVGLPGGVSSSYFKLLQEANVNNMELREGKGNVYEVSGRVGWLVSCDAHAEVSAQGQQALTHCACLCSSHAVMYVCAQGVNQLFKLHVVLASLRQQAGCQRGGYCAV